MKGTAFFRSNGRLICTQSGPDIYPPDGTVFTVEDVDVNNPHIYYDGTVHDLKTFATQYSTNKLTNIPAGTRVIFLDQEQIVNDDEIDFSSNIPGSVFIHLDHPHYKLTTIEIQVS